MYQCRVVMLDFNCYRMGWGMCVKLSSSFTISTFLLLFFFLKQSRRWSFLSKCPKYCHLGGGGGGLRVDA